MGSWPGSGERLVLVGMMGTGKSTVGRLLAESAACPFLDSDEQIEAVTGRTVREIFESDGEPAFRRWERRVLHEALAAPGPSVIAAAGGVVLAAEHRRWLGAEPNVVWLRAEPDVLERRVATGTHRPLLAGDPAGTLRRLAAAREPLYREVADHVVDVGSRNPAEVAAVVLELIG